MYFFFINTHEILYDKAWQPFAGGLTYTRKLYPQITVGALETFLHISRNQVRIASGAASLADLAREMRVPYPTFARHTDMLGKGVGGNGGLGLLQKVSSEVDRKLRRVELTTAGLSFLTGLHAEVCTRPLSKAPRKKMGNKASV